MTEISSENIAKTKIGTWLTEEVSGAPLVVFRILFAVMMLFSIIRFAANGWIDALYVKPSFFFSYYGFEWVKPLNEVGIYTVFILMTIAILLVFSGYLYRVGCVVFFLLFTYVELIDKANYLNHYYFISLVSLLLCFLPLNHKTVPRWAVLVLQLQIAIVYFFAGVAKINTDWLLNAMPLKIWLATKTETPIIGQLLNKPFTAYFFSWCGMLFDTFIVFFLFNRKTVKYAYIVVVVFHILTAILFPVIGVFPFVMIVGATIFLPASFHEWIIKKGKFKHEKQGTPAHFDKCYTEPFDKLSITLVKGLNAPRFFAPFFAIYFLIQILLPLRSHFYTGNLFYHEQGYRFSWRVMLMEKAGLVFFHVKDTDGKTTEVNNRDFLTMQQEKQMSTQPDMILQFAHHLAKVYKSPEVYAEAYVSVNGRGSKLFLDSTVNLAKEEDGFAHKKWILSEQ